MKHILKGILGILLFFITSIILSNLIVQHIFSAYQPHQSYHVFTYTGLMLLCGVIITCTSLILDSFKKNK